MTPQEAFKILNIEDYAERIFNASPSGELWYLGEYVEVAEHFQDNADWYREVFIECVEYAEANWENPELVFIQMFTIMQNMFTK